MSMTGPLEECGSCQSKNVKPHCEKCPCRWIRCRACKVITGWAYGKLATIPGQ